MGSQRVLIVPDSFSRSSVASGGSVDVDTPVFRPPIWGTPSLGGDAFGAIVVDTPEVGYVFRASSMANLGAFSYVLTIYDYLYNTAGEGIDSALPLQTQDVTAAVLAGGGQYVVRPQARGITKVQITATNNSTSAVTLGVKIHMTGLFRPKTHLEEPGDPSNGGGACADMFNVDDLGDLDDWGYGP